MKNWIKRSILLIFFRRALIKSITKNNSRLFRSFSVFVLVVLSSAILLYNLGYDTNSMYGTSFIAVHKMTLDHIVHPFISHKSCDWMLNTKQYLSSRKISSAERFFLKVFVHEYMKFHSKYRYQPLSRKLIFRPFNTGLGDRFERLITSYYVAVVSKRIFLIDWDNPSPIEDLIENADCRTDMFLRATDMEMPSRPTSREKEIIIDDHKHDRNAFIATIHSNEPNIVTTVEHRASRKTLEELGILRFGKRTFQVTGFFGSHVARRAIMHNVFRLNRTLFENFVNFRYEIGLLPDSKSLKNDPTIHEDIEYVSVHARLGIGVGELGGDRFETIQNSLQRGAKCLAKRAVTLSFAQVKEPTSIFLATDTSSFRSLFSLEVEKESRGRISTKHGNWDAVHTYFGIRSQENSTSITALKYRAITNTYLDLVTLGGGAHILALQSSFARFAFAIGTARTMTQLHFDNCTS